MHCIHSEISHQFTALPVEAVFLGGGFVAVGGVGDSSGSQSVGLTGAWLLRCYLCSAQVKMSVNDQAIVETGAGKSPAVLRCSGLYLCRRALTSLSPQTTRHSTKCVFFILSDSRNRFQSHYCRIISAAVDISKSLHNPIGLCFKDESS